MMTESFETGLPSRNIRDYRHTTAVVDAMVAEVNERSPYNNGRGNGLKLASVRYYVIRDGAFTIVYDLPGGVVVYSIEFGSRGRISGDNGRKGKVARRNPPVSRILQWIERRGLRPRSMKTGRFIKITRYTKMRMAYAIAHKIGDYGTAAKHNAPRIWSEVMQMYQSRIDEALVQDLEDILKKNHADLFR